MPYAYSVILASAQLAFTGLDVAEIQQKAGFVAQLQKDVAICALSAIIASALSEKRGFANLLPALGDQADPF